MTYIKVLFFILTILNITQLNAEDFNLFSYPYLENIDVKTGKSIGINNSPLDFENTDEIKFANILINDRNGFHSIKMIYENGLLKENQETIHDGTTLSYVYDEKKNLVKILPGFHFLYPDSNCRDRFCRDKLQVRERIFENENDITVIFEKKLKSAEDKYQKRNTIKYYYNEQGKISLFVSTSFKYDGSISGITQIQYYYKDGMLEKIIESYGNLEKLEERAELLIVYDDKKNVVKNIKNNFKKKDESYVIIYKEYDTKGNWHLSEKYKGEVLVEKIERSIAYN
ncbi:MAG: hypothetical protein J6O88_16290 [Chryseobacterium sp.]|uniref:hypothetical protein n=1 Tax=Chryseobacterium sp. TaxID=1871047 RepID=UPI001B168D4A|nr:hypothetical protein [Chryseobacterium sp.]MBO6186219.1 hypothetical protein [Chryseobacterium sp.]